MFDLIVFDLDGTLIDSVGDIADALNAALASVGRAPLSDEQVSRLVGAGAGELVRRALGDGAQKIDGAQADFEIVRERFLAAYAERPARRTGLYLGVRETLAALDAPKAIATNKPGALARKIVEELGVAGDFFAVLGEDDVGRRKPDPLVVDLLRGRVGAARARTLYVGDSRTDAQTAEAARVPLCLVTYGYEDPRVIRELPARWHVDRFSDLKRITRE
ncbi:MAG TPA: HAD hydrolase-like protein [Polyangia bacterium]|nr:HAD hydrolase-like protein [Polyangia bacterium]